MSLQTSKACFILQFYLYLINILKDFYLDLGGYIRLLPELIKVNRHLVNINLR